jgi:hypothetical protein
VTVFRDLDVGFPLYIFQVAASASSVEAAASRLIRPKASRRSNFRLLFLFMLRFWFCRILLADYK